jgi:hypothetical protein
MTHIESNSEGAACDVFSELDRLRIPSGMTAPPKVPGGLPRHQPGEPFLKGPVPWRWLEKANALPGKAGYVGLVLWREAGWRKTRIVKFSLRGSLPPGLNRQSARRGLYLLERAGLVVVNRKPGRGLEITIQEYRPTERSES